MLVFKDLQGSFLQTSHIEKIHPTATADLIWQLLYSYFNSIQDTFSCLSRSSLRQWISRDMGIWCHILQLLQLLQLLSLTCCKRRLYRSIVIFTEAHACNKKCFSSRHFTVFINLNLFSFSATSTSLLLHFFIYTCTFPSLLYSSILVHFPLIPSSFISMHHSVSSRSLFLLCFSRFRPLRHSYILCSQHGSCWEGIVWILTWTALFRRDSPAAKKCSCPLTKHSTHRDYCFLRSRLCSCIGTNLVACLLMHHPRKQECL